MIVSSMAGMTTVPYQTAYSGTKAFLVSFGTGLFHELRGRPVSMTTFVPGGIQTEMTSGKRFGPLRGWLMPVDQCAPGSGRGVPKASVPPGTGPAQSAGRLRGATSAAAVFRGPSGRAVPKGPQAGRCRFAPQRWLRFVMPVRDALEGLRGLVERRDEASGKNVEPVEAHREATAALGDRTQLGRVAEHAGHGDQRFDHAAIAFAFDAFDASAPR